MAGAEKQQRDERARRLHEEIERLRSGTAAERKPRSPREFLDRAAREKERDERESAEKGDEERG